MELVFEFVRSEFDTKCFANKFKQKNTLQACVTCKVVKGLQVTCRNVLSMFHRLSGLLQSYLPQKPAPLFAP